MRDRRVVATGLGLGAIAALLWWLQSGSGPEPAHAPQPDGGVAANADAPSTTGPAPGEANRRQAATDTTPAPTAAKYPRTRGLELRVRLRGLHPSAKWTAPLLLTLDGRDATVSDRVERMEEDCFALPDSEGLAVFVVPDWVASAIEQDGHLMALEANYRPVRSRWDGAPALDTELVVDVQVVANLTGRVVDTSGNPVRAARVTAFAMRDGTPLDQELVNTNTNDSGDWQLAAPPGVPLFLLATPMRSSGRGIRSLQGALLDTGEWRDDLLPTSARARGEVGTPVTVPDLVLPAAPPLRGRVRWRDGAGVEMAEIQMLPSGGIVLALAGSPVPRRYSAAPGGRNHVELAADGTLHPGARATTDADGAFTLPARAGATVELRLEQLPKLHLLDAPTATTIAPQPVEFVLPRPISLQARHAGAPVAGATLELASGRALSTDGDGVAAVVTTSDLRVRAAHGALRSAWLDVPATAAGTTVTIELLQARVPLAIEFDGDFRVRNTIVSWRRDDGEHGTEHLMRDDRSGPFRVFLEAGRYHVTAGPGGGERNGVFLLPVERDVDLTGAPGVLLLPATFGGTFTVTATDSSGLHVGGICRVRDAAGGDFSDSFTVVDDGRERQGKPGELLPGAVNHFRRILPPGDYVLELEFERHGAMPQRVTIKPREVAEVRVRLP